MDTLQVKLESLNGPELTVRQGDALPLQEPNLIRLAGNITAIAAFLSIRREQGHGLQVIDAAKAVVVVNKKDLTITLKLDPENHYGAEVVAKLEYSDELRPFQINQAKTFTREELIKLIRFNRLWFADPEKQDTLLKSYMAFNATAHADMAQSSDTRGNRGNHLQKTVQTNVPTEFILDIPVFKGEPRERFRVEICLDVTDGGARFWFESVELAELAQQRIEEIFQEQLKSCEGLVVIHQ